MDCGTRWMSSNRENFSANLSGHHFKRNDHYDKVETREVSILPSFFEKTGENQTQLCIRCCIDAYSWHGQFKICCRQIKKIHQV